MNPDMVVAIVTLVASLLAIAGWVREITRKRRRIGLALMTLALVVFSGLTIYFWQRDERRDEGREEAVHLVANFGCSEWGQEEAEEIIGSAIAFFRVTLISFRTLLRNWISSGKKRSPVLNQER